MDFKKYLQEYISPLKGYFKPGYFKPGYLYLLNDQGKAITKLI